MMPIPTEDIPSVAATFNTRTFTGRRDRALFLLAVNCGLRISELLSLTMGDVVGSNGRLQPCINVPRRNTKGQVKGKSIYMNLGSRNILSQWLPHVRNNGGLFPDSSLFPIRRDPAKPMSRQAAWKSFTIAYERAGMSRLSYGCHGARKSYADRVYSSVLDRIASGEAVDALRIASQALAHASLDSTTKYLSFRNADVTTAIEAASIDPKPDPEPAKGS